MGRNRQSGRDSERSRELFRDRNFAHLTTLNPDGSPQTTVLWVDEADGEILLNIAAGRVKVANIRRDPRVSVSLQSQRDPCTYVAVSGRARLEENHAEDVIDSLAKKFTNQDKFPAESRGLNERRITIRIQPHHIYRYGY
ncbi:MAG: PPOX class F420-dependent oxidoreductase [Candidatus Dormiibacterota bacterium]